MPKKTILTTVERKARKILFNAYNEYMDDIHYGYSTDYSSRTYFHYLDLFRELFPKTNTDNLEKVWDAKIRKSYRED